MSEYLGRIATLEVSTDGGTTWLTVGEAKDLALSLPQDLHDATTYSDDIWKVDLRGHRQVTLTYTCQYDKADAGQLALISSYFSGTGIRHRVRPEGNTSTAKEFEFDSNFNSLEISPPTQGISELSVDVQSTGTVTQTTIP